MLFVAFLVFSLIVAIVGISLVAGLLINNNHEKEAKKVEEKKN